VFAQEPPAVGRVIRREQVADRLERDLEIAQPDDRPGRLGLVAPVGP